INLLLGERWIAGGERIHAPAGGALRNKAVSGIDRAVVSPGTHGRVNHRKPERDVEPIRYAVGEKRDILGKPDVHAESECRGNGRELASENNFGRIATGVQNAERVQRGSVEFCEVKILM